MTLRAEKFEKSPKMLPFFIKSNIYLIKYGSKALLKGQGGQKKYFSNKKLRKYFHFFPDFGHFWDQYRNAIKSWPKKWVGVVGAPPLGFDLC